MSLWIQQFSQEKIRNRNDPKAKLAHAPNDRNNITESNKQPPLECRPEIP